MPQVFSVVKKWAVIRKLPGKRRRGGGNGIKYRRIRMERKRTG
jgi:hypothetical protein